MRHPRILRHGARYHVIARANRQEFILQSKGVKILFLQIIKRAKLRFNFTIETFVIMSNHVHILIRPHTNENLSKIMQWILATFAINFNKRLNLIGHVWYDRFHSNIIKNFKQWKKTFDYINENPVKGGLCNKKNDYFFSGWNFIKSRLLKIVHPIETHARLLYPELISLYLLPAPNY